MFSKLTPVKQGGALNRRQMERNLLNVARKLNNLHSANIARNSLENTHFKKDAFQEIWWNRTEKLTLDDYHIPDSSLSPSAIVFADAAGDGDFNLRWSLNLKKSDPYTLGFSLKRVTCLPFAGDKLLWSAADLIDNYFPHSYDPATASYAHTRGPGDSYAHSMNGGCTFSTTGNFSVGLMFFPDAGDDNWGNILADVTDLDITLTRAVR